MTLPGFESDHELAIGSVKGIRRWNVTPDGTLTAYAWRDSEWVPGENVAGCSTKRLHELIKRIDGIGMPDIIHPRTCGCGFYAYYKRPSFGTGGVVGVIEGYGETTLGSKGFRAQKARIIALEIPKLLTRRAYLWAGLWIAWFTYRLIATIIGASNDGAFAWPILYNAAFLGVWVWLVTNVYPDRLKTQMSAEQVERIRAKYPDVPVYKSRRKMLRAHPLDKAPPAV